MKKHGRAVLPLFLSLFTLLFSPAASSAADDIIAEIDGTPVTASEISAALAALPKPAAEEILKEENRKKFVENYLTWKLLVREAKRRKIDQSSKYSQLIERAQNDILLALLQEKLRSELSADEKDIRRFYDEHPKEFKIPEKRKGRHILVKDEKKAKEILARIQKGGKFESEARLHSEDQQSAAEGGDIGWQERDQMVAALSKVFFSMAAGTVHPKPVQSQFGWHILKLETVTPEKLPEFKSIHEEVRVRYMNDRAQSVIPDLAGRLKEKSSIKIFDDRLPALTRPKSD